MEASCNRDLDCTIEYSGSKVYHEDDLVCYADNCYSSTRTTTGTSPEWDHNTWIPYGNFGCFDYYLDSESCGGHWNFDNGNHDSFGSIDEEIILEDGATIHNGILDFSSLVFPRPIAIIPPNNDLLLNTPSGLTFAIWYYN